jgi:hypothetical protein
MSGELLHSRVAIDNNNVLNISKAKGKDFECFHHKEMVNA